MGLSTWWFWTAEARARVTSPLEPVAWLRPGGVLVTDDFTPMTSWPPRQGGVVDEGRPHWLEHPELRTTEVRVRPTAPLWSGFTSADYRQRDSRHEDSRTMMYGRTCTNVQEEV